MSAKEPVHSGDSDSIDSLAIDYPGEPVETTITAASQPISYERLFRDYLLDGAFDEMRTPDGGIRPHYQALVETLANCRMKSCCAASSPPTSRSSPRASPSPSTAAMKAPSASFPTTCCRG
jgi:hypothetical protein